MPEGRSQREKPRILPVFWRGLRRRCPHCGRGALFEGWFRLRRACRVCGLLFEKRPGDTWAFWVIGDRVFIAALLVVIVLGVRPIVTGHVLGLFLGTAVPLIATMPQRLGLCIGLDYLSRAYLGRRGEIPPLPSPRSDGEGRG